MSNQAGIYKLTSPSGKVYIGQAYDLNKRFKRYRCLDCKHQNALYNAFLKYTPKSFNVDILFITNDDTNIEFILNQLEEDFINLYDCLAPNGYNLKAGGRNAKMSDESKKKMSDGQIKRRLNMSDEEKQQIIDKGSKTRMIKIDQYDLEGNFIKTWESAKDAARELNISSVGNISSVCRGGRKSTGGFMFKYNNELERYNSKAKKNK